jgi:2-polyprenyl-3-methyl-5-hydroxy-6-metoxy-1,4-benzoquinol methylase
MISPSQEWIWLSEGIFSQNYCNELAIFLVAHQVKTVLEACCGGGHILNALAKKGMVCEGFDSDTEMIQYAKSTYGHENITFHRGDIRDQKVLGTYDAVLCRGNSLVVLTSWNDHQPSNDPHAAKKTLEDSISYLYASIKPGGLLFLDTISGEEIKNKGGSFSINVPDVHLVGEVEHDWRTRLRTIHARGIVAGEPFTTISYSYLIRVEELIDIIYQHNPAVIWRPRFKNMPLYDLVCARK